VFGRGKEIIIESYDGKDLRANAYGIKESGDGFLGSIRCPFASPTGFMADDAARLVQRFDEVLQEEARILQSVDPVDCGIGIALDKILGFDPDSGTHV
jgi:hypothetical protein